MINKRELERVKYIKWGIWSEITGGTRSPRDAAKNILSRNVDTNEARKFWEVSDAIKQGVSFPELILVGTDEKSPLVVLEGHVRITAYFLRPEHMPSEMEVIVGLSKDMDKWSEY
jgi:hypothetical protein